MSPRAVLLYLIFFCSGASALTFETLWFRQAGLALGNSVWAGSMVLAAFMAGLALGNWLAGRFGDRVHAPIRAYGILEFLIGAFGLALVLAFPLLNQWLVPVFRPFVDQPWILNSLRLLIGFGLLLVPTAAMGATLPLMVRGLQNLNNEFSTRLGRLYAINTLGAMAGTLCCELLLIGHLGIRGTGYAAAGMNLFAGLVALALGRPATAPAKEEPAALTTTGTLSGKSRRILAAAFLSGCSLLALEVIWFRYLLLFNFGTSRVFAFMLAIVLCGIALGGMLASRFAHRKRLARSIPLLALSAGVLTVLSFQLPSLFVIRLERELTTDLSGWSTLWQSIPVMLPVSLISGMLFTLMGAAIREHSVSDTKTVGVLTLFNTTGAMCGAMLAGFVLLPAVGLEWSFMVVGLLYGGIGLLTLQTQSGYSKQAVVSFSGLSVLLLCLVFLIPRHLLSTGVFLKVAEKYTDSSTRVVALREGLTASLMYTEESYLGEPLSHRLITNSHSMSATNPACLQYMKQYVYLPIALHPNPRRALLISYGCGITAKALTDTKELTQIAFVDISQEILNMNRVVYPDSNDLPLNDPRVRVTIEDGRFFLQTRTELYDLITSEPPPPIGAGIVNLYSKEYFQLIHDRLAPGGMTTYWLPHHSVRQSDARAIIQAFCDVFPECSLWFGGGENWLLLGVRDGHKTVTEEQFRRQWSDTRIDSLTECGFEVPEQMASYFICDRAGMLDLANGCKPVVDNFPHRISPYAGSPELESRYGEFLNADKSRDIFAASPHIQKLWPEELARSSLKYFDHRNVVHDLQATKDAAVSGQRVGSVAVIHQLLSETDLATPVLWSLGSSQRQLNIVDKIQPDRPRHVMVLLNLGHGLMAARDYAGASEQYASALSQFEKRDKQSSQWIAMRLALAQCLSGNLPDAQLVIADLNGVSLGAAEEEDLSYLMRTFNIKRPGDGHMTALKSPSPGP